MTAQLSPVPVFKAFGNDGEPLAGGLLYAYIAGTTTPQNTYTDSTEATPNLNPAVLNARGECALWLDPGLFYKFLLTDSLGNTIPGWPVDNIPGGALTIAFLAANPITTGPLTVVGAITSSSSITATGAITAGGTVTAPQVTTGQVFGIAAMPLLLGESGSAIQGYGPQAAGYVDMTPDSGSFTGTITGIGAGATSGTILWRRNGNIVILNCGAILSSTSNTTAFTMTGLPAGLQPTTTQILPCNLLDNGSNTDGAAQVGASSTITFLRSSVSGSAVLYSSTGFTSSGFKGFNGTVIGPYMLA